MENNAAVQCFIEKKIIIISLDTSEDCIATLVGHTVGELHWGGQPSARCPPPHGPKSPPLAPFGVSQLLTTSGEERRVCPGRLNALLPTDSMVGSVWLVS